MSGDFAGIGVFDFDFHATQGRMKMGFGLSTDLKVVQDHGGEIRIESKVAKGTEVTITYRRSDRRECNLELADASPLTPPSSSSNDGKIELQHVNVDRITCDLRVNATAEPAVTRIATF